MFRDDVKKYLSYDLTSKQLEQLDSYYEFLIEYNKITNLTRIVEKNEVFYKHFYDSISLIKHFDMTTVETFCDMGAGAGFPSIPLKILFPHLKITIIDSLGKRIIFLKKLIEKLNLMDVNIIYDRVENYAHKAINTFDIVTARALGRLPLILELGLPMVKINGLFIAYKTSNYEDELKDSKKAIEILGGKLKSISPIELPHEYGNRTHIIIQKNKKSPAIYPRLFSIIKKKSL